MPKENNQDLGLDISVERWHERIATAKKVHEDWVIKSGANRFVEEYNGDFSSSKLRFVSLGKSISIPAINEVYSFVQTNLASMYGRDSS